MGSCKEEYAGLLVAGRVFLTQQMPVGCKQHPNFSYYTALGLRNERFLLSRLSRGGTEALSRQPATGNCLHCAKDVTFPQANLQNCSGKALLGMNTALARGLHSLLVN